MAALFLLHRDRLNTKFPRSVILLSRPFSAVFNDPRGRGHGSVAHLFLQCRKQAPFQIYLRGVAALERHLQRKNLLQTMSNRTWRYNSWISCFFVDTYTDGILLIRFKKCNDLDFCKIIRDFLSKPWKNATQIFGRRTMLPRKHGSLSSKNAPIRGIPRTLHYL